MKTKKTFFMVFMERNSDKKPRRIDEPIAKDDGQNILSYEHDNIEDAIAEARATHMRSGADIFVLQAIKMFSDPIDHKEYSLLDGCSAKNNGV